MVKGKGEGYEKMLADQQNHFPTISFGLWNLKIVFMD